MSDKFLFQKSLTIFWCVAAVLSMGLQVYLMTISPEAWNAIDESLRILFANAVGFVWAQATSTTNLFMDRVSTDNAP